MIWFEKIFWFKKKFDSFDFDSILTTNENVEFKFHVNEINFFDFFYDEKLFLFDFSIDNNNKNIISRDVHVFLNQTKSIIFIKKWNLFEIICSYIWENKLKFDSRSNLLTMNVVFINTITNWTNESLRSQFNFVNFQLKLWKLW